MSEPKFYFVYGLGKSEPQRPHETLEDAAEEAKRLAGEDVGVTFVVMETKVISGFMTKEPEELQSWELRDEYQKLAKKQEVERQIDDDESRAL